mmetsp:Transcript_7068/g.21729  ORF Transcript_7068/g.21729 Transcript_7068/m.21729 type:complete len:281 (-) Transcript_7068:1511-2353(-)
MTRVGGAATESGFMIGLEDGLMCGLMAGLMAGLRFGGVAKNAFSCRGDGMLMAASGSTTVKNRAGLRAAAAPPPPTDGFAVDLVAPAESASAPTTVPAAGSDCCCCCKTITSDTRWSPRNCERRSGLLPSSSDERTDTAESRTGELVLASCPIESRDKEARDEGSLEPTDSCETETKESRADAGESLPGPSDRRRRMLSMRPLIMRGERPVPSDLRLARAMGERTSIPSSFELPSIRPSDWRPSEAERATPGSSVAVNAPRTRLNEWRPSEAERATEDSS